MRGEPASPNSPVISLSNLANIPIRSSLKAVDAIRMNIWKPARMKKYKFVAKLVGFEKSRLLEIDSQEKIRGVAERPAAYTNTRLYCSCVITGALSPGGHATGRDEQREPTYCFTTHSIK